MTSLQLPLNLLGKCLAILMVGIGLLCIRYSLKPENDLQQIERLSASFVGKLVEQAGQNFDTARIKQPQVKILNVEQTGPQAVVSMQISAPGENIFTDLVLSRNETSGWKVLGVSEITSDAQPGSISKSGHAPQISKTDEDALQASEQPVLDELLKTAFEEKEGAQVHRF